MNNKLSIIIPAYNEEKTIQCVLDDIMSQQYNFVKEIIVVNDGSNDNTAAISESAGVKVITFKTNQGYGHAVKAGIRAATGDFILMMDSDGQHKAKDIMRLWQKVEDHDLIVGARLSLIHSKLWRMPGKWFLLLLASYLVGRKIPDLNSGLRIFRRDIILKYLKLCCDGFSFSSTSTIVLLYFNQRVTFVPIKVKKRSGKSTVKLRHGFNTIVLLLRLGSLFSPLKLFFPPSFFAIISGFFWGMPALWNHRTLSLGALLIILIGFLLFMLGLISDQISQLRLEQFE